MDLEEPKQVDKENVVLSETDTIGPGHPPKQHQFKKGLSGNPKGRPKKPPKSHDLLWAELRKPTKVKVGGKETRITRLEAMLLQLKSHAVNGDRRAIKIYLERVAKARWRKNGCKVEVEEPVDFSWNAEYQRLYDLMMSYDVKSKSDADEIKTADPASPDNAPEAHAPVTSDSNTSRDDTSPSAASGSTSANLDSATVSHESTSNSEPTNQESTDASLESSTTIPTKLKENDHG
jgi:hypothetical protein